MSRARITTTAANGPAPRDTATLYIGSVMHQRLRPFGHRFDYTVFSLLVDVDRLPELATLSRFLSVNRPGMVALNEKDHVEREGETLRQYADRLLGEAGLQRPASRVLLLAYPRILGYVFNPISVYFAYDESDELIALIYAVQNTFGERHSYVAPVLEGEYGPAGLRQTRAKTLHVSPFIPMDARYHFRIMPPGKIVRLRIQEEAGGAPCLSATFTGTARRLDSASLAGCLCKFPWMSLKFISAIPWWPLRLGPKGGPFHKSPPPPPLASFRDN